jgi:hypothetical protein
MIRWLQIGLGIGFAFLTSLQSADAGIMYSFQFDQSNYDVSPNGVVNVEVFLRQTGTPDTGETNVLGGTGAVGMTGTGVRVTFPTSPNDAQVLSVSDIMGNGAFDNFGFGPFTSVSAGSALLSQATSGAPVFGTTVASDTYDLLLGTFQFTAGGVAGQVTTIGTSLPLFPNSNDNVANTTPLPTSLTSILEGSATITVTGEEPPPSPDGFQAAPEPCSLSLSLTGTALILCWTQGKRRRRDAPVKTTP